MGVTATTLVAHGGWSHEWVVESAAGPAHAEQSSGDRCGRRQEGKGRKRGRGAYVLVPPVCGFCPRYRIAYVLPLMKGPASVIAASAASRGPPTARRVARARRRCLLTLGRGESAATRASAAVLQEPWLAGPYALCESNQSSEAGAASSEGADGVPGAMMSDSTRGVHQ